MQRTMALLLVLLGTLVACGQRGGVHEAALGQRFQQEVGVAPSARGESSRTRHAPWRPASVAGEAAGIPGGRRPLRIDVPADPLALTWPQWAVLLLRRLQAPGCANNVIAVVAWEAQENTRAAWNPLATTYDMPGATEFNSAGVKNYRSLDQGLDATVATLAKGFEIHGYGPIVAALRACAGPTLTAAAINASSWCRGCSGGAYVTGVVGRVIQSYRSSVRRG